MDYKVNFKTKPMEWKTKYNKFVDVINNFKASADIRLTALEQRDEIIRIQVLNLYGAPLNFYFLESDLLAYFDAIEQEYHITIDLDNVVELFGQLPDSDRQQFLMGLWIYKFSCDFDGIPLLYFDSDTDGINILYAIISMNTGYFSTQRPLNPISACYLSLIRR